MKRLLLVLRHTKEQFNNDSKYIGIQKAFKNLGFDVWRTYIDETNIMVSNGEETKVIGKINPRFQSITRNTSLYSAVSRFVKSNSFDMCYIRSIAATGGYVNMFKAIKKTGCKLMVEIPTYPAKGEFNTDKVIRKLIRRVMAYYNKKSAKVADLYLLMGEKADSYLGCPAINIENGVDADIFNVKTHKENENEIHMIFVGKVARWHGVDRIIEGMREYYHKDSQPLEVFLHIIGPDADGTLKSCENLITEYSLENYIFIEGPKYGDESDEYFDRAHIAIASLGDHRRKIKNISLLKNKEYMARGIPFIYSMDDNMINPDWAFCHKVSKDDTPLNIDEAIEFYDSVKQDKNISLKMREMCKNEMTWEKQLIKAVNFFAENNND